jgi:hypothetical protein
MSNITKCDTEDKEWLFMAWKQVERIADGWFEMFEAARCVGSTAGTVQQLACVNVMMFLLGSW